MNKVSIIFSCILIILLFYVIIREPTITYGQTTHTKEQTMWIVLLSILTINCVVEMAGLGNYLLMGLNFKNLKF